MAYDLSSVERGVALRPPRIILLGTEKIGKTTFASRFRNSCLFPIIGEEGSDDPDIRKACTVLPTSRSLEDVFGWMESLRSQQHIHEAAVVDSVSALEPLIWANICKTVGDKNGAPCENIEQVLGGYGKGFTVALERWHLITEWLDCLRSERNMASIIIGHVKVKRFDDPAGESYDQYQFDIHEKAANLLVRWADLILFANRKTTVCKEDVGFNKEVKRGIDLTRDSRFLYTQKRPAHPGGGRGIYGRLPYELPLDYPSFEAAVAAAMGN